jgi:Na+/H+ antiporter NhaD/arsenite permease-like protein
MTDIMSSWTGIAILGGFVLAYVLVILEERLHLRKSKPVVLIGCLLWVLIALYERGHGGGDAEERVKHLIGEIGELFFFLLAAMTYINALQERLVFDSLRAWLIRKRFGFRSLFWITGGITFCLSPVADNLTSALLMATVAEAVGGTNRKFIVPAFINIVVAANAGGAWSPFGDITTLMVWTSGKVATEQFLVLMLPSVVNWVVPAAIMFLFLPKDAPSGIGEAVRMKPGARRIVILGFLTIATAVSFHQFLHLPPFLGMMTGLGFLMFMGFYLKRQSHLRQEPSEVQFDIFRKVERVEFDTLLFFFGIITAVGALQHVGYLTLANEALYGRLGNTYANIMVGILSALVDNIPLMYAVIQMNPVMDVDQWLLITLTAGTGGSLLSIGSAAGVAVMGVRRDAYTFLSHLKWAPAVAAGYAASILCWKLVTG